MMRLAPLPLLVMIAAACQGEPAASPEPPPGQRSARPSLVFTEADAGRPLRVRAGQLFGIRLVDNASIGHVWRVAQVPAIVRDERFLYDGDGRGDRAAGAPTSKTFRFTATRQGRGTLQIALDYRDNPTRTLSFEITVE